MKHLVKLLSLGAALVASPLAHATTLISIGLQEAGYNSGNISTVATDSGVGTITYAPTNSSYGTFSINSISATGSPILSPGTLTTTSVQVSNSSPGVAGVLTVYITEQGLTSPLGNVSALSTFTSNLFLGATSVVESTYFSSSNALYGGTQMASATFTGVGSSTSTVTGPQNSSPYSETVKYMITVGTATATVNDGIGITAVSAATPEPSSLIMLGTGLMSAAGMMVRRRKIS